ncbi:retrovirus-related pol polyprotein from transposon TNT 1-94 [Tanacetum coccineum]
MMKGSDIGIQEKKAKLFNEWERFTSIDGKSIKSYYHHFSKLINDFKRNKHFPEKIASNLKFLNNLQPEWSQHVTIVHQIKDLHTADYTQLYDFLKYNQVEVTYMQQPQPNDNYLPQPSFNQNNMQQPMINPEDISDPTTTMNMALIAQLGMNLGQDRQMQMVGGNGGNQFRQYAGPNNVRNQNGLIVVPMIANPNVNQHGNGNVVAAWTEGTGNGNNGNQIRCYNYRGLGHLARNCIVRPRRWDAAYLQTQLLIAQKEEAGIQLQAKEFDLMTAVGDLNEIEEVNANCILMANLQQASTSGTRTDKAPMYVLDGSAEVHEYDNCYNNEIFNMFTQEEQYTKLLDPIPKPHHVQQNDSNVIFAVSSVEQSRGTVEQHPATTE